MTEIGRKTIELDVNATEQAFERIREAFEKVAKDEAGNLNIVQGIMLKAYHRASRRTRRCHCVVSVPTLQQFPFGGLHFVGLDRKEALQLVVRKLWRKCAWRAPNRLLVVRTGVSAS